MRYIGRSSTKTVIQIDPSANSFVNVKSFGAAGLDRYFEGRVRGISTNGKRIYIGDIGNYFSYEGEFFQQEQELYTFFYNEDIAPDPNEFDGILTNLSASVVGVISAEGIPNAQTLRYYIYAYNPKLGRLSPYRKEVSIPNVYKNPVTQFDEDNYARFTLTRSNSEWLPVIFRQWGSESVRYIGIPSNNILGTNSTITFNDRGPIEIPSWDEITINQNEFFPEFFQGILEYTGGGTSSKTMLTKRRLRIVSRTLSGVLECVDAESANGTFYNVNDFGIKAKFKFDDTNAFQKSLDYAAINGLKDVFIPSGTFSIRNIKMYGSSGLLAKDYSGIVIRGSGEGSVLKRMASTVNPFGEYGMIGMLGSGVTNRIQGIKISNLLFDGNKTEVFPIIPPENDVYGVGDKYNDCIALEYADGVRVSECSFYNAPGAAIYSLDSTQITLSNNKIFELSKPYELNVSPLKIYESSRVIAQGNLFENCSGPVDFTGIDTSTINSNIINNCGETGILLRASDTWSAQGNLAFNENGSLIKTIDLYQNDYSKVNLDVKKGLVMPSVYFTVTEGGLPVAISPGSISARIYELNSLYNFNFNSPSKFLQVLESNPQLEAGIFAITLPINDVAGVGGSNQSRPIKGSNQFDLLNPTIGDYGYGYRITATVAIGRYAINRISYNTATTVVIYLRNSSDLLSFLFFSNGNPSNDNIKTIGVSNVPQLSDWPDGQTITVQGVNTENASVIISIPEGLEEKFISSTSSYDTPSGYISIIRDNYLISDGNIYTYD
jgi:hypothetical protein